MLKENHPSSLLRRHRKHNIMYKEKRFEQGIHQRIYVEKRNT
jgi:hypothetical protein